MPATPKIVPADPKLWRQGFLDLRPSVVPCPGFTLQSWGATHEKCIDFLDRWADEAVALGWTTLDLFGVHPEAGIVRPDFCGAIVMSDAKVSAITARRIALLNTASTGTHRAARRARCRFGSSGGDLYLARGRSREGSAHARQARSQT